MEPEYSYNDGIQKSNFVNEYFKPPVPIKTAAKAIHHITEPMVLDKPSFIDSPQYHQLQSLSADYIFIAHNAAYDLGMLAKEGITFSKFICTLKVAKHLDKGQFENHQLQYLRYFYDLNVHLGDLSPHDALADIIVLEALFYKLKNELHSRKPEATEEEVINRMIEISSLPSLLRTCNFKKHKGVPWAEVARIDREYLEWFKGQPELDEDLKYTLNYYLTK